MALLVNVSAEQGTKSPTPNELRAFAKEYAEWAQRIEQDALKRGDPLTDCRAMARAFSYAYVARR